MTKPTLDDLRRSAEFCGRKLINGGEPYSPHGGICVQDVKEHWNVENWNPPENADQDRELLHKLLEAGYDIKYCSDDDICALYWSSTDAKKYGTSELHLQCHPNDFLTLAASKVQEMNDVD